LNWPRAWNLSVETIRIYFETNESRIVASGEMEEKLQELEILEDPFRK